MMVWSRPVEACTVASLLLHLSRGSRIQNGLEEV